MPDFVQQKTLKAIPTVEQITEGLSVGDLNDLCDATEEAIQAGGGFGWVQLPNRGMLERFWQGVLAMPVRILFVARLDGVICGAAQLVRPAKNNEAQASSATLTGLFISPWARGQGLSRRLLDLVEKTAVKEDYKVMNLDLRETQSTAIHLYETNGYQLIGIHPHYAMIDNKFVAGRYYFKLLAN
jgi:ribosomal protein S18 acetylase RimI-like enzyme